MFLFLQRYYTATAGRFYTPDPAGMNAVDLQNPTEKQRQTERSPFTQQGSAP